MRCGIFNAIGGRSCHFVLFRFRASMRKSSLYTRRMGENLRVSARVVSLVMSLSRSLASGATCTVLCAGVGASWAGMALGQDENATVAQRPVPKPNTVSAQMKPITADIANTDAQRINADADQDNWRLHGRTYDNQRFSPLTEINAGNVKQLKPVSLIQTGVANAMESTPLEIDGVLFVEAAGNVVQAYDAVTGEELWSYTPVLEYTNLCCGPQARGVAVGYGKVYVAQVDGHVVAL